MSKGSQKRRTAKRRTPTRKAGEKCGTCRFFVARNTEEAKLATYARDESECGPGEWVFQGVRKVGCHGGPVYGHCQKAGALSGPGQEPFPPSRVASTFWCQLWRMADGLQIRKAGSVNRASDRLESGGAMLALGAVALLAAAAQWKRKGSSNVDGVFVGVNEAYTLFDEGEITLAQTRERMRGACGELKSGSASRGEPFTVRKFVKTWGIVYGSDPGTFGGSVVMTGFKTKKKAQYAASALEDARFDHSRGRKNNYDTRSHSGYTTVDIVDPQDTYGAIRSTAATGLTKAVAKDLAIALRDANSGDYSGGRG